jgi:Cleaved Adhesin Domain.
MRKNIFTILCCLALTAMAVGCSDVENPAAPDTVLDKTTISFTIAGGNENVAITTPSAWTISTGAVDWVSVTPMSGTGNATVAVTVAPNVVTKARSVTLTITAENAPAVTILVLQNGTTVPEDAGTIQGYDINTCPEETVTLTIPELAGATSYQWYMNGNAIAGATTTSYTVTQNGIYNVAGVNQVGVGEQSPNKTVTIVECILPDDAGTIQGLDENVCPVRTVTLTIADIAYAETYNWYRNGTIISGATTTTYVVTQSGTYTVAGLNPTGEGALSPAKAVTINDCGGMPDDLFDDAESHANWTINSPGDLGWSYYNRSGATWGIQNVTYPGAYEEMAFIVFNPSQTDPSRESTLPAFSGSKYFASFQQEDDLLVDSWMISPEVAFTGPAKISFWARCLNTTYPDRFKIGYSTTGKAKADFTTFVTPGSSVLVDHLDWERYTYDIPADAKYIAIQNVSVEGFALFIDDIFIGQGPVPTGPAPVAPASGSEKMYEKAKRK